MTVLRLLGGDDGVAVDQLGHDAAHGLDALRERGHVEEQQVLGLLGGLAGENATLHGGAVRNGLVGVDAARGLLAVEVVLDELLHLGDARGAADEHDLVDLGLLEASVGHHLADWAEGLLEEVNVELLEAGAGERLREVLAVVKRLDLHLGGVLAGEGALDALDLLAELLHDALVEVLATQVRVAVGGEHLEDAVVDGKKRHVERTAAEVEDENVLLATLLVQAVRDSGGGGLVDDAHDVEARDGAGVLGGLALRVVEIRGHGNDGVGDGAAEVGLGDLLHLLQDHGGDLLGGVDLLLALGGDLDVGLAALVDDLVRDELLVVLHGLVGVLAADEALDVEDGGLRVDGGLVLGGVTDEALAGAVPRDVRRRDAVALVVGDDLDTAVLEHADARVRGAEVDANHGADRLVLFVVVVRVCGSEHERAERKLDALHNL